MEQICIAVIVCCMSYSGVLDSGNCKEFSKSQMLALSVLSVTCIWVTQRGYTIQSRLIRSETSTEAGSARLPGSE